MSQNIHYLIIGIALIFVIAACIVRPAAVWLLAVSVLLVCIELFSRVSKVMIFALTLGTLLAGITAQADTNAPTISGGLQEMAQAISSTTNWSTVAGGGHSLKGRNWLAFGAVAYDFNQNVGVVAGVDSLFAKGAQQSDVVQGGITLKAPIHLFAFIGSTFLTNIVGIPFASELMANPTGNTSAPIGAITTGGINFNFVQLKNFEFGGGLQVENRQGQGRWNGNYGLVHLELTRLF
jgi:hypothetical protein